MRLYVKEIFHFVSKKVVEKRLECISKDFFYTYSVWTCVHASLSNHRLWWESKAHFRSKNSKRSSRKEEKRKKDGWD